MSKLSAQPPDRVFNENYLNRAFRTITRITGPSLIAICDATDFRPSPSPWCRRLLPSDKPALDRLKAACSPEDWEYSALNQEADEAFGCFEGDLLAAAGRLHDLRGQVLSVPLTQAADLEVIEDRYQLRSTVVTSQLPVSEWHDSLGS